jgi:hypothetical protein
MRNYTDVLLCECLCVCKREVSFLCMCIYNLQACIPNVFSRLFLCNIGMAVSYMCVCVCVCVCVEF